MWLGDYVLVFPVPELPVVFVIHVAEGAKYPEDNTHQYRKAPVTVEVTYNQKITQNQTLASGVVMQQYQLHHCAVLMW